MNRLVLSCFLLLSSGVHVVAQSLLVTYEGMDFVKDPKYSPSFSDSPKYIREKRSLNRIVRLDFPNPVTFSETNLLAVMGRVLSLPVRKNPSEGSSMMVMTNAVSIFIPAHVAPCSTHNGSFTLSSRTGWIGLDELLDIVSEILDFRLLRHGDLYFFATQRDVEKRFSVILTGTCDIDDKATVTGEISDLDVTKTDFVVDRTGRYLCVLSCFWTQKEVYIGDERFLSPNGDEILRDLTIKVNGNIVCRKKVAISDHTIVQVNITATEKANVN